MTLLQRAFQRQSDLKLRQAAENMIGFPFYAAGWGAGKVWLLVKLMVSLVVVGFEDANRKIEL